MSCCSHSLLSRWWSRWWSRGGHAGGASCWCCGPEATSSRTEVVRIAPGTLKARGNARRRTASSRHSTVGCRCAPRPGARPAGSGRTSRPCPRSPATTRSRSVFAARCRHPTHVRTLPWTGSRDIGLLGLSNDGGEPPDSLASDAPGTEPALLPAPCRRQSRTWSQACFSAVWSVGGSAGAIAGSAGASSERMSMRQPVSRAASRAFCPSLPIASDSW